MDDLIEHKSDCAVYNAPALPDGACDCGAADGVLFEKIARWVCVAQGYDPDEDWSGRKPDETDRILVRAWETYREETRAALRAIKVAGYRIVPTKTIAEAHAVMRECGWQLAPASATSGDGVLEAACAEIEEKFRAMLAAAPSMGEKE